MLHLAVSSKEQDWCTGHGNNNMVQYQWNSNRRKVGFMKSKSIICYFQETNHWSQHNLQTTSWHHFSLRPTWFNLSLLSPPIYLWQRSTCSYHDGWTKMWGNHRTTWSLIIALGCAFGARNLFPFTHCQTSQRRLAKGPSIPSHMPPPHRFAAGLTEPRVSPW